jgi:hypothetical protein
MGQDYRRETVTLRRATKRRLEIQVKATRQPTLLARQRLKREMDGPAIYNQSEMVRSTIAGIAADRVAPTIPKRELLLD